MNHLAKYKKPWMEYFSVGHVDASQEMDEENALNSKLTEGGNDDIGIKEEDTKA